MLSLQTITSRSEEIKNFESKIATNESRLHDYESELAACTEELKLKHSYDAVVSALSADRSSLAAQKSANMRDATFLAIDAICGLLDADPERVQEFLDWLSARWKIREEHNDYAGGRDYAAHFRAFIGNVCRGQWWAEEKYETLDDGGIRVEQDQRHPKDPCIALVLPADILSDPGPFLEDCRSFTETAAEEWAERYVEANAGRTAKLDALRKALGKGV